MNYSRYVHFAAAFALLFHGEFIAAQEIGTGGVKFSKHKLLVSPYESCAVADINRDGHLDIVYGAYWFAGPDWLPQA
ncbi:MAG TPA: FG-GAP repeat protein, partial [Lacipirellulaceae bacterium]|nr:FG-GAP repeat protein [Lacipirellulaceae bacterium]